tara:strand:- start:278 stop:490 length:213 start_codon:yes stop_codon:yes gene_type:complete
MKSQKANGSTASRNRMKKLTTDVMGNPYIRTDEGKKVNENTYVDYSQEYGATPSKKEARKYKRKVKKGKI